MIKRDGPSFTYLCFRLANMLLLKQELPIEVADINDIQINLQDGGKKVQFRQTQETSQYRVALV